VETRDPATRRGSAEAARPAGGGRPWQGGLPAAVIFDCDGVLVDSEPVSAQVAAETLTRFGVPMTAAECHARFTGGKSGGQRRHAEQVLGRPLEPEYEAAYEAALVARYHRDLVANRGAVDLIAGCARHGIQVSVASNGNVASTTGALEASGLMQYFGDRVYTSVDVERGKPAPDLFLLAAARLGVDPARCLVIEDSPPGIQAGTGAGMTVWALAGTFPASKLRPADRVFGSLAEIGEALGLAGATAVPDVKEAP
jgi:HAD superfamily hydrolase (TIGR01509 family)